MAFGNPQTWASCFKSVDQRLLERIHVVWPKCLALLPSQPEEDCITQNLIHLLSKDEDARRLGYIDSQYEPFHILPNGAVSSTGYIDFALIINNDRDLYIGYECKRLNVIHQKKRASLAMPYIKEGMMRFIKSQYSKDLPFACMLGYVMDGDIPFAKRQIWQGIKKTSKELLLINKPTPISNVAVFERFLTTHKRKDNVIELKHAFLPFTKT